MYDFVIGICAYNSIKDETFVSIENLHYQTKYLFKTKVRSREALIGRSRSVVCTEFLRERESNVFIFVDTDTVFKPEDIDKLLKAVKQGYDVISGACLMADNRTLAVKVDPSKGLGQGIQEAVFIPTGFMAISYKALNQIVERLKLPLLDISKEQKCYPFFESGRNMKRNIYISEDWDFCDKVRAAGMKVYWHSDVLVGHIKDVMLRVNPQAMLE